MTAVQQQQFISSMKPKQKLCKDRKEVTFLAAYFQHELLPSCTEQKPMLCFCSNCGQQNTGTVSAGGYSAQSLKIRSEMKDIQQDEEKYIAAFY